MPSPYVKKLSQETGKSEKEIEKLWKKAKEIASEEFGKTEDDFGNKEYAYVTGIVKKMLGVDESILDPSKFLESDYSAKDYIETVVSGNFSIGNVKPPKEDEEEDEEEDDDDLEEASIAAMRQVNPGIEEPDIDDGEGEVTFDDVSSDEEIETDPGEELTPRWTPEELADLEVDTITAGSEPEYFVSDEDYVAQLDKIIEKELG